VSNVHVEGLSKRYGTRQVLSELALDIAEGECFTLLGPSGCGKTVLMRLIAGFEQPDEGTIAIVGHVVADRRKRIAVPPNERGVGMVFQDYAVWPHMTVFANVAYPLKLGRVAADSLQKRADAAIALVGLAGMEARLPSQLSGGQQQRVALARALVSEPRLLLLDEPLNNLDANLREEMRFEIKALQRKLGITILYVTHDQEIALALADRIAVMDETGRLRQIGTPEQIYDQPADDFVFRFLGVANFLPVTPDGCGWRIGDSREPWSGPLPQRSGVRLVAGFRPGDVFLAREGTGLPGTIKRVSFLGAEIDYLVDIAGTLVRAALPSHDCLERGLLFAEGDACRVKFHTLHWFDGAAVDVSIA
jgi:iron(III) transport system ATP-binding protein